MTTREETGIEALRRAARVSGDCNESAFDGFTAEECLRLIRACWASGWDMYPHDLTPQERDWGARYGKLSATCLARLQKRWGG